jgi:hypothetical protein
MLFRPGFYTLRISRFFEYSTFSDNGFYWVLCGWQICVWRKEPSFHIMLLLRSPCIKKSELNQIFLCLPLIIVTLVLVKCARAQSGLEVEHQAGHPVWYFNYLTLLAYFLGSRAPSLPPVPKNKKYAHVQARTISHSDHKAPESQVRITHKPVKIEAKSKVGSLHNIGHVARKLLQIT